MSLPPIITFSSIDWDFTWQGHQEVMSRLAALGHPVLFVENTGIRRPMISDFARLRRRAVALSSRERRSLAPVPGLQVLAPRVLPFPYSHPITLLNAALLEPGIRKWLRQFDQPPIVWTYLPTPLVLRLAARLRPALLVYYCVDNLPESSNLARRSAEGERQLFRSADLVMVTSEQLREKAARYRPSVHVVPSGVSMDAFANAREAPVTVLPEFASLRRPVVGYVGGLHRWFDVALTAAVARRLPDVQFVLVGPAHIDVSGLERVENVHLLGPRPHSDVPALLRMLDAAIIPYVLDAYTRSVFPTKLSEYLAMGLPSISTPLPDVVAFRNRYGAVVDVAATADEFAEAVRRAVSQPSSDEERRTRIDVASAQDWGLRVAHIETLLNDALAAKSGATAR